MRAASSRMACRGVRCVKVRDRCLGTLRPPTTSAALPARSATGARRAAVDASSAGGVWLPNPTLPRSGLSPARSFPTMAPELPLPPLPPGPYRLRGEVACLALHTEAKEWWVLWTPRGSRSLRAEPVSALPAPRSRGTGDAGMEVVPGFYRHFKGGDYRVERTVWSEFTREWLVQYRSVSEGTCYVRPLGSFCARTQQGPRFTFLGRTLPAA